MPTARRAPTIKGMKLLAALAVASLLAAGCGEVSPQRVPDVTGDRLDVAEDRLDDRGLHYETIGGGVFGVVVRSHWVVCDQEPAPGKLDTRIELLIPKTAHGKKITGSVTVTFNGVKTTKVFSARVP